MTHSEASIVCRIEREKEGTWKFTDSSWTWVPSPEHDVEVVNVLGSYCVQLKRNSKIHGVLR